MGVRIEVRRDSPFTIHNIPFGVVSTVDDETRRCAAAIGDFAIDLALFSTYGPFKHVEPAPDYSRTVFEQGSLNAFAASPRSYRSAARETLIRIIREGGIPKECLINLSSVKMHLPMQIGGFSDFYCSLEHVQNCSPMAAGLSVPRNWFYAPSVYNGRASSVVPSPQAIRRPRGVFYGDDGEPVYGPSRELDFELEMGVIVATPIEHGTEIKIENIEEHIFGFVLLNDWSARDLQVFEMKPLGPFHGKGFGTSISPWVVTLEALQPFRCAPTTEQSPAPFAHLKWPTNENATIDIKLKVTLKRQGKDMDIATSNLKYLYWTPFQQLAHHASAMCGMAAGDLIGTGTISGNAEDDDGRKLELGCLYESSLAGSKEVALPDGSLMKYLDDGDEVILQAWCGDASGEGISLGFGECRGAILPAFS